MKTIYEVDIRSNMDWDTHYVILSTESKKEALGLCNQLNLMIDWLNICEWFADVAECKTEDEVHGVGIAHTDDCNGYLRRIEQYI